MKPLPLSKEYEVGSEGFSQIEFRAPGYQDYRRIGPVYEVQRGIILRDRDAIFAYAETLVTKPAAGALSALDIADTLRLEEHVLDFFIDFRTLLAKPTSSSSGSNGPPTMSTG